MPYVTKLPSVDGKLGAEIEEIGMAFWKRNNKILLTQISLLDS